MTAKTKYPDGGFIAAADMSVAALPKLSLSRRAVTVGATTLALKLIVEEDIAGLALALEMLGQ